MLRLLYRDMHTDQTTDYVVAAAARHGEYHDGVGTRARQSSTAAMNAQRRGRPNSQDTHGGLVAEQWVRNQMTHHTRDTAR